METSVDITFKNIMYSIQLINNGTDGNNETTVLNNISGIFKSGEVTAIMGASGSGKTTLLNVVSRKIENQPMDV